MRVLTTPNFWVSDQGSHFINETLRLLAEDYLITHKPTVAYAPWANGTMGRLNRDLLAVLRSMLAELNSVHIIGPLF